MSDNPLEEFVEGVEKVQQTPIGHRLAKAGLAALAAVAASWLIEKAYDRALESNNESDEEDTSDISE